MGQDNLEVDGVVHQLGPDNSDPKFLDVMLPKGLPDRSLQALLLALSIPQEIYNAALFETIEAIETGAENPAAVG